MNYHSADKSWVNIVVIWRTVALAGNVCTSFSKRP